LICPVIWTVDSRVSVRASYVLACKRVKRIQGVRPNSDRFNCTTSWDQTYEVSGEDALDVARAIPEDDEDHPALAPKAVDPPEHAHALAALLNRLLDLDLCRLGTRLGQDDQLGVLEPLELDLALGRTGGLVAEAELLCALELLLVLLEELSRLLDGRVGRRLPRRRRVLSRLSERGGLDGRAVGDESPDERLVRLGLSAVTGLIVSSGFIKVVDSVCSGRGAMSA